MLIPCEYVCVLYASYGAVICHTVPHNDFSTCATGCLLLLAIINSGSKSPLFSLLFLIVHSFNM